MSPLRTVFFFIFFFSFVHNGRTQSVEDALENVQANYALEKIYIHYDKESYLAGETTWFKVYLLSGFMPSTFSSSICIELMNDSSRVVEKKILPVINGVARGDFTFPKDATQMNYTIRAYTRRLMNFGSGSYYYHQLPVFNPSSIPKNPVTAKEYRIYFLPESGNFVSGIKNTIAFKCTDQWGYPAEVEGKIVDKTGSAITDFRSVHDGMGKFDIIPAKDESYTAVCTIAQSVNNRTDLPPSRESGVLLNIQKQEGKTWFVINSETIKNNDAQQHPAYLLAVMENTVIFKLALPAGQANFRGLVPVNDIPSGILQVTVFNGNDKPLAERLLFVFNRDFMADGKFNTDTVSTASHAKNVYSFELADSVAGSYSVSITDADADMRQDNVDNIVSRFLLTSDIKGYVHNPRYYFEGINDERKNDLDLVMLTNGWRRFNWDDILNKRLPQITYKDPYYISLKGLVYDEDSKALTGETNLTVYIKTKDAQTDISFVPVNKESAFDMPGMVFYDTASFYIMDMFAKNKKRSFQFSNLPVSRMFNAPLPVAAPAKPLLITEPAEKVKNLFSKVLSPQDKSTILLSEVKVKTKAKSHVKMMEEKYIRNGVFNSYAAATLDLMDEPVNNASNIFEYLKTRLPGVTITGGGGNYQLNYRGTMSLRGGLVPMTLFLDESQVFSTADIATIPMTDIAMVKLYSTGFIGAEGGGAGGALAIYTKKGDDYYKIPGTESLGKVKVEGFSPVKEFFSPDYSAGKINPAGEDNRTTLYWDPLLETDPENKKLSFSFYNADHVKKFRIILEGVTADGKLVHLEKIVE